MLKPVGVTVRSVLLGSSEELYELFFGGHENSIPDDDSALLEALERPVAERLDAEFLRAEPEVPEEDAMEIFTEGRLHVSDGLVRLSYTEQDDGSEELKTILSFREAEPKCVSMSRSGAINTTFLFEVGKRTKCVYNLAFGAMELTIFTLSVDNRLLEEGVLVLDYCIEIRGSNVERRVVTVRTSERGRLSVPREQPLDGKTKL